MLTQLATSDASDSASNVDSARPINIGIIIILYYISGSFAEFSYYIIKAQGRGTDINYRFMP